MCKNADAVLRHCIKRSRSFWCRRGTIFRRSGHMSNLAESLVCQIWHTDGYGSTPSAWVYSQFLPSGKLKIIILTKSFIILLFYSKSWKSWMAMYWALWWCYSSFEAKKTLSSSVTLWCNGLWCHTKGPSLLRTLEKFYSIEIEIKTEIDHWKYLSLSRLLAPLTLITNI